MKVDPQKVAFKPNSNASFCLFLSIQGILRKHSCSASFSFQSQLIAKCEKCEVLRFYGVFSEPRMGGQRNQPFVYTPHKRRGPISAGFFAKLIFSQSEGLRPHYTFLTPKEKIQIFTHNFFLGQGDARSFYCDANPFNLIKCKSSPPPKCI